MYHAYKNGYSVLPQLGKLGQGKPFQVTLYDVDRFLSEKREAIQHQTCFVEDGMTDELYKVVCDYIIDTYPIPLFAHQVRPRDIFGELAMQIQEDLVIHRLSDDRDWMAAGYVCFPSGWNPVDKIGRPLSEIHAPIPGMDLSKSRKLVETMVHHGPFERYVWGPVFEDRINFHPRFEKRKFDPQNPVVYVKVERQITVGFPEHGAALFILRQHLIKNEIDYPALSTSLKTMTEAQREYKGINDVFDDLIAFLDEQPPLPQTQD